MTGKRPRRTPDATGVETLEQFPVFPPRDDMENFNHLYRPSLPSALERHYGISDNTVVVCEAPVSQSPGRRQGLRIPDLLVAFKVNRPNVIHQMGYSIQDQGKPPDFVLGVASPATGRIDYTAKRTDYAAFGIPEYWRFDSSGGRYYDAPLAGDLLVEGQYRPIDIIQVDENHYWGHSPALNLALCWEFGHLRWWNPATRQYLRTFAEEADGREQKRLARLSAESQRDQAEARVRELEEEIRRLQGQ